MQAGRGPVCRCSEIRTWGVEGELGLGVQRAERKGWCGSRMKGAGGKGLDVSKGHGGRLRITHLSRIR